MFGDELVVHCFRSGFRTSPRTPFLSKALGLTSTLVTFSKAVYPSGVVGNLAHKTFAQEYQRLYPSRTSYLSEASARELITLLALMTPEQMSHNWLIGRWIRAKMMSLCPTKCKHRVVEGIGLLIYTDLALDPAGLFYQYKRLLPAFNIPLQAWMKKIVLKGVSALGCNECADHNQKQNWNQVQTDLMTDTEVQLMCLESKGNA